MCYHSRIWKINKENLSCLSHAGVNGERKYSFYPFFTSALDGMIGQRHTSAALYPQKWTQYTHCIGSWVASEQVWTQRLEDKYFASAGDRTSVAQSLARQYSDWATPAPVFGRDIQPVGYKIWLQCPVYLHSYS
jgi:hypothetical protein